MFTKQDMRDYFSQIIEMEKKMLLNYRSVAEDISSPKYKPVFEALAKEEGQHALGVRELLKVFTT